MIEALEKNVPHWDYPEYKGEEVALFIPCFIDQVKVLEKLNIPIVYPDEQTCCGQPAFNSGYWDDARKVMERFGRVFEKYKWIVTPSGACAAMCRVFFEEADKKLREAGFVPMDGNIFQLDGQIQDYEGREVYGHKATLSVLGYTAVGEKSNMLAIMHYFLEDSSANREHPGKSFTDVREKLTQSLGKEPKEEEGFLFWELKGRSSVMMGYVQDGLWMLVYAYSK